MLQATAKTVVRSLPATARALRSASHLLTMSPSLEMVHSIRDGSSLEDLRAALADIPLGQHDQDIDTMLAVVGAGDPASVAGFLSGEAKRLFRSRYPKPIAPLHESMWTEPGRASLGKAAIRVADIYRHNGVHVGSLIGENAPDSLARELEFVAYTMEQEIQAARQGDADAVEKWAGTRMLFVAEHVNNWMPDFVHAVCADGESGFYCAAARICASLIGVL